MEIDLPRDTEASQGELSPFAVGLPKVRVPVSLNCCLKIHTIATFAAIGTQESRRRLFLLFGSYWKNSVMVEAEAAIPGAPASPILKQIIRSKS